MSEEEQNTYRKPLPVIDALSKPFWDGCKRHELVIQRCSECGHVRWPISPACTTCLSASFEWVAADNTGEIMSWIVYHHVFHPEFATDIPYNVALIKMDGGYTMVSNIVDEEEIGIGQRVSVVFDDVTDEVSIPRFVRV